MLYQHKPPIPIRIRKFCSFHSLRKPFYFVPMRLNIVRISSFLESIRWLHIHIPHEFIEIIILFVIIFIFRSHSWNFIIKMISFEKRNEQKNLNWRKDRYCANIIASCSQYEFACRCGTSNDAINIISNEKNQRRNHRRYSDTSTENNDGGIWPDVYEILRIVTTIIMLVQYVLCRRRPLMSGKKVYVLCCVYDRPKLNRCEYWTYRPNIGRFVNVNSADSKNKQRKIKMNFLFCSLSLSPSLHLARSLDRLFSLLSSSSSSFDVFDILSWLLLWL